MNFTARCLIRYRQVTGSASSVSLVSLHLSLFQLHYDSSFVFEMLTTKFIAHPTSTSENAKFNNPLGTAIVLYFLA